MDTATKAEWLGHIRSGLIELWVNNLYLVIVYRHDLVPIIPSLRTQQPVWLSISRLARTELPRDWRDLQRIKNEILGHHVELVELFPDEDRLVDESNQTHLWGFEVPGVKFPFGYADRLVQNNDSASAFGGSQRVFEFEPGDWHIPPASVRRIALDDEDILFLCDLIDGDPPSEADLRVVAEIRAVLDGLKPLEPGQERLV